MVKLFAALAQARDETDVNIAFGEAVPRVARLRNVLLVVLVTLVVAQGIALASIEVQVDRVQKNQRDARQARARMLDQQAEILATIHHTHGPTIAGQRRAKALSES